MRLVVNQKLLISRGRSMVELVHNNVVIKIRGGLGSKILGVKGLNREKQVIDTLWPVIPCK